MSTISPEEVRKIKEMKGETVGASIKEDFKFILEKEGEEGLKALEKEMQKSGFDLKFDEIKNFQRYPVAFGILLTATAKYLFNWTDDDLREGGRFTAKASVITRVMARYFITPERGFSIIGQYWRKYYTVGEFEGVEFNEEKKFCIMSLKNFSGHPANCHILEGYLWQISFYLMPDRQVAVEEIECPHRGGTDHRFKVSWS